ncbi:hypothetical protein [Jannaschia ovalis]|uniref:Uncharacterized protein n=1 Tax=Jannaschia ovalis TaxID=3038773 RepID=A0ABY8LDB4_9RHOB|nr:hypothetical protein [Jannaschia sp. GRR-S6-38]WGH79296.1 hypothetical protein P8627_03250 [Jannaschia sp. GRR-S6-38]
MHLFDFADDWRSWEDQTILLHFWEAAVNFVLTAVEMPHLLGLEYVLGNQEEIMEAFNSETRAQANGVRTVLQEDWTGLEPQLARVGLTRMSLRAKIGGLTRLTAEWDRLTERAGGTAAFATVTGPLRRLLKRTLAYLFGLVNKIIGSLSQVIPGAHALGEIKDLVENTTDFVGDMQDA